MIFSIEKAISAGNRLAAEFSRAFSVGDDCLYLPEPFDRANATETIVKSTPYVLKCGAVRVDLAGFIGVPIDYVARKSPLG